MKKNLTFLIILITISSGLLFSQSVGINGSGNPPDPSSVLDLESTSQGLLIPRMTRVQRVAIGSPANGLIVYQTDGSEGIFFYNGATWDSLVAGGNIGDNLGDHTATQNIILDDALGLTDADQDTKIQLEETNDDDAIRFDTRGVERMVIDDNGNIGIGTSNPQSKLDISSQLRITRPFGAGNANVIEILDSSIANAGYYSVTRMGAQLFRLSSWENNPNSNRIFEMWAAREDGSGNPAQSQVGDGLGSFWFSGYDGTTTSRSIMLGAEVSSVDANTVNSDFIISVKNDGNVMNARTEAFRLHHDGHLSMNFYGSGNKERFDLGLSASNYLGRFADDGTLIEVHKDSLLINHLSDADQDTKIQLEETNDDDAIRFDLEGSESFKFERNANGIPRLEVLNSGSSIYIGDQSGDLDDGGNFNVALGTEAMENATETEENVAIGYQSGRNIVGEGYNVTIGSQAGQGSTTHSKSHSVHIGYLAGNNDTVNNNVSVGSQALQSNTTGHAITAIGRLALADNTSGDDNVAVGHGVLEPNTTGAQNTAIGTLSLSSNFDGSENTAVGAYSLASNLDGIRNVGIGTYAGQNTDNGSNNVSIGFNAFKDNEDGSANVSIGSSAGQGTGSHNKTGTVNIGFEAGSNNETDYNIALGYQALQNNTSGANLIAIGQNALDGNTTGSGNIAIGANALGSNGAGISNIGIGLGSLLSNSSGNGNIGLGANTLQSISAVHGNVALGFQTQRDNISGSNNSAMGYSALINNETGDENVAIGMNSLYLSTNSIHNVAIGYQALYKSSGTSENVVLGYRAGEDRNSGDFNVLLGSRADFYNQTGSNNVLIGKEAGHGAAAHSKSGSVFIGYQSGYNETGSNKLYIENSNANASNALIYGEFDNDILRTNGTFQIGDPSASGFAFPTTDGTIDQVLATDGSGALTWHTIDDLLGECPTGFTAVTAAGKTLGCIEDNEADYDGDAIRNEAGDMASYWNAENYCFITFGGRLPTTSEWYVSLNNNVLSNEIDDYEQVGNWDGNDIVKLGSGSLTTFNSSNPSTVETFRCWIPK